MTKRKDGRAPAGQRHAPRRNWRNLFLAALAETSNVTAAAEAAGIDASHVYRMRKKDPAFARQWLIALCEGYESLEMEVLGRLRAGENRQDAKEVAKRFDNAAAIRLLGLHRANAARGQALRDHEDEKAVLASIDAKIDRMIAREAANDAILRGDAGETESDPKAGGDA